MKFTGKQIYWGLGITVGVVTFGIFIHRHKTKIKQVAIGAAEKAQKWLHPVTAKITSGFGYRTDPKTGKPNEFHNGIDLAVPSGTPIKSPMSGVVDSFTTVGDGGNQVIIKHDNGYKTGYAHLTTSYVKKGDKIKQGDVFALSGNSGKSTGPHLHFTLTDPSGAKVDPQKIIYAGIV